MTPIFAYWNASGNPEDVRATGISGYAQRVEYYPYNGVVAVVLLETHQSVRQTIDALHPALASFPGPNGKLAQKHAAHVSKAFPKIMQGDAHATLMAAIYAKYGAEVFNPANY